MLSRGKILKGNYIYRRDLMSLRYSNHAKERLIDRTSGGLIVAPSVLRIGENNIYTAVADGQNLTEVTVRLNYKRDKWMFLVVCLHDGSVKTVWINDKKKKTSKAGRIIGEATEVREEMDSISKDMGGETSQEPAIRETLMGRIKKLLLRPFAGEKPVSRSGI